MRCCCGPSRSFSEQPHDAPGTLLVAAGERWPRRAPRRHDGHGHRNAAGVAGLPADAQRIWSALLKGFAAGDLAAMTLATIRHMLVGLFIAACLGIGLGAMIGT